MLLNDVNRYVILPALKALEPVIPYTPAAHALVLGTGLVESNYDALVQRTAGGSAGVAQSFWQIEPATYNDTMANFVAFRTSLNLHLTAALGRTAVGGASRLSTDLLLGALMCRVIYFRSKSALPPLDAGALARYHKTVYNTALGAADPVKNTPVFQRAVDLVNTIS